MRHFFSKEYMAGKLSRFKIIRIRKALRITSLVHEMQKRNARYGIVGTPGAGGVAMAAIFERKGSN